MLIDDVNVRISAGHGGKGNVSFNKNMMSLGPAGGSGGKGGSVYAEGVSDLSALGQFRFKKEFAAEERVIFFSVRRATRRRNNPSPACPANRSTFG